MVQCPGALGFSALFLSVWWLRRISRIEQMIDPDTDAVHLLPACVNCGSRLVVRDQADGSA